MSLRGLSTVVLERQLLVREGLISLISHFSFEIVADANGLSELTDLADLAVTDGGKSILFILGSSYKVDQAIADANVIRERWPNSKVVLLTQQVDQTDFQKILNSSIVACIPLFVSRHTLIKTLELVAIDGVRIMMAIPDTSRPALQERTPTLGNVILTDRLLPEPVAKLLHHDIESHGKGPKLSDREMQILDGLVRGHANKLIARSCDITEATVKVHMKSILRKIQVSNRTQAAVWALANGHTADELSDRLYTAAAE